jgi:predicted Zn-dependent protease
MNTIFLRIKRSTLILVFLVFVGTTLNAQSIEKDKRLGKEAYENVVSTMGLYEDSAMTAYVNKLGQKLVSHLDSALFDYHFYIINEESPNAFAVPGGYVFITTGILPLIETEDEFACIIGHEIIHANNRHTIRQVRKRIIPVLVELPVDIVAAIVPGADIIAAPVRTTNQLLFASYSRKFETEADDYGIALAAKSGYDPTALPRVLNRMNKAIELITGESESKSYFADHPYTPDRNANIEKQVKKLRVVKSAPVSSNFLMEFNGVIYGESAANGVVRKNVFMHPDIDFYIKYPEDWAVQNMDTAVAASSPDKDAALVLTMADSKLTAEQAGKKYLSKLSKNYKSILSSAEPFKVNDNEGYLVSFEEVVYGDTTHAYVLWLTIGDNLFRLTAVSNNHQRKTLLTIAESLRKLTPEERASIMDRYMKVVQAQSGETMKTLSERTGNTLRLDLLDVINDRNKERVLKEGDLIKIVIEKPYVSKVDD